MKNILIILALLLLFSTSIFAQKVDKKVDNKITVDTLVAQKISTPLIKIGLDTATTNKALRDSVNELKRIISEIEMGGGFVSGSFLKAPGVPYDSVNEIATAGKIYQHVYGGIGLDTSLIVTNEGSGSSPAIYGISSNNAGVMGYSTNTYGMLGLSTNSYGGVFQSAYGPISLLVEAATKYNAVFRGNIGDSVIIGNAGKGEIRINTRSGRKYKADSLGYVYNSVPHVALTRSTDITITADQNVWYKITGFTTKKNQGLTVTGDSVQLTKAGSYHAVITISFSGLNNEVWEFAVFKAGILEDPSQLRYTSTTDVGNATINTTIESDGDDWISFKIRNTTDGDDPTIQRFSANIKAIQLTP
jgi:hypothetical protein